MVTQRVNSVKTGNIKREKKCAENGFMPLFVVLDEDRSRCRIGFCMAVPLDGVVKAVIRAAFSGTLVWSA